MGLGFESQPDHAAGIPEKSRYPAFRYRKVIAFTYMTRRPMVIPVCVGSESVCFAAGGRSSLFASFFSFGNRFIPQECGTLCPVRTRTSGRPLRAHAGRWRFSGADSMLCAGMLFSIMCLRCMFLFLKCVFSMRLKKR